MLINGRLFPRFSRLFFGRRVTRFGANTFRALCLAVTVYLIWLALVQCFYAKKPMQLSIEFRRLQALASSSSDSSKECKVPQLNPYDASILKYVVAQQPLHCGAVQPQMAKLSDGALQFDATLFASASCSYRTISHNEGVDDAEAKYGDSMPIELDSENRFTFEHEMIEVECTKPGILRGSSIYKMHFANVLPRTYSTLYNTTKIENSSVERPSVIMIGVDSMSRSNFLRQDIDMDTLWQCACSVWGWTVLKFLRKLKKTHTKMQEMGFIDMKSHVKIGDNTYANWMAILAGKRGTSTKEFPAELIEEDGMTFYDDVEMVWRNFSKMGYATLFAEDRPEIATFNYMGKLLGFKFQPTDHYFRTYWLAAYWSLISRRSTPYCYDSIARHRIQLDYLVSFLKAYENRRKFAFWWTQDMSHDFLNVVGKSDADYADFFTQNEALLNDSIVIVFSDHGHRYDVIRETVVGRLEARLPFLSIRIPPAIDNRFPHLKKILRENSEKMTTQFDLHETLNVLAKGEIGSIERKVKWTKQPRAFSLFHSIPNRSCLEAQIPDDYCPCYVEKEIPLEEAKQPTKILLASINELLSSANLVEPVSVSAFVCSQLELANITYASVRIPPTKVIDDPQADAELQSGLEIRYRITFLAKPSDALIEGIVVKDEASGKWSSTGEYERNNKYGNTSHCVIDPILKKLCFCVPKSNSSSIK